MLTPLLALSLLAAPTPAPDPAPRAVSGIYPSLAMFNAEGECGTGAVVPWADRLWVITYGPHMPYGSSDKLYEITPQLKQIIRPESVGGTPANRMIHPESAQLFIGPYVIDPQGRVRVIPPARMPGRLTGNARHLSDPAGKIYYATMEEGLYEVDVHSLAVTSLIRDGNVPRASFSITTPLTSLASELPGYHGKGLSSSQGRLVYANNGDRDKRVLTDPTTPSGALGEWRGTGDWQLVRRNQFTEVTGPGGIAGSAPDAPLWSIGWDAKSLILMLLDGGQWESFRLPKISHSYDGAHGWNTEWPRIRDIGEDTLLMTMHGAFWHFPKTFSAAHPNGIRPRSAYLKVIGDFCRWQDRLVFGCDDSARSEFLNTRKVKGGIDSIGQSQSNLWFTSPETPDQLGPAYASGAVWLHDRVKAGDVSDRFLVSGWKHHRVHALSADPTTPAAIICKQEGDWLQVMAQRSCADLSVVITLSNGDSRSKEPDGIFEGVSRTDEARSMHGIFRPLGGDKRTLGYATDTGYYELGADLELIRVEDPKAEAEVRALVAIPKNVITLDAASVLVTDDRGRRWRLPRATRALDAATDAGELRVCREVATERDLLNVCGTFFELPAENADGFAHLRPVSSHPLRVTDFGSYRGLLLLSGIRQDAPAGPHVIRSADGKAALWAGALDDLWKLGKPRGEGGPWRQTQVRAGEPSDPYLLWGYDQRTLRLEHDQTTPVDFVVEGDVTGTGQWVTFQTLTVAPSQTCAVTFPEDWQARWLRITAAQACTATAQLKYE